MENFDIWDVSAVPPKIFSELENAGWYEKYMASAHNEAPPEMLKRLSVDANRSVRQAVASNKSTPPDVLAQMWETDVRTIRQTVFKNKSFQAPRGATFKKIR